MRRISYLFVAVLLFSACKQAFKKGDKGLEYKVIADGNGPKVKIGDYMQMHISQTYNNGKIDSVLSDTRTSSGPIIEHFDSTALPPEYITILGQMRKGDSLVIRMLTDTMFAQNPGTMPGFMKKGHYFCTTVKLLNIFTTQAQMDSARAKEFVIKHSRDSIETAATMKKDDKTLQELFKKLNINVSKAPLGTYVQIIDSGSGAFIDTSVVVVTNYTGKTMEGKMFDSNTDPSKGHVEPFKVNMTNDPGLGNGVIKGWTDGMTLLKKGAKAKFYIPSGLAYGNQKAGEDIAANSILIFDIEIVDVLSRAQAQKEIDEKRKKREESQKRFLDSMKKLQPDTTKRK